MGWRPTDRAAAARLELFDESVRVRPDDFVFGGETMRLQLLVDNALHVRDTTMIGIHRQIKR